MEDTSSLGKNKGERACMFMCVYSHVCTFKYKWILEACISRLDASIHLYMHHTVIPMPPNVGTWVHMEPCMWTGENPWWSVLGMWT